jgi:hypothetical protein
MAPKQPDLGVTIKRRIMGPRTDLETLPGFWMKPKKYSSAGGEEIQAVQFKISKGARNPVVAKYVKRLRSQGIENPTVSDVADTLDEEELAELLEAMGSVNPESNAELQSKIMLCGTGEHNFRQGGKVLSTEEAIPIIVQDIEAVKEIIGIIKGWNSPLASEPSEKSGTQSSGSTEK